AGDTILIRSFSGTYTGADTQYPGSIIPKPGTAGGCGTVLSGTTPVSLGTSTCTEYSGYQNERPLIRGFNNITFVYIKNLIVEPNWPTTLPSSAGLVGVFHSRIENVEIRNVGLMGMDAVGNSEMINMNVHDVGFDKATCTLFGGGTTCYGIYT